MGYVQESELSDDIEDEDDVVDGVCVVLCVFVISDVPSLYSFTLSVQFLFKIFFLGVFLAFKGFSFNSTQSVAANSAKIFLVIFFFWFF